MGGQTPYFSVPESHIRYAGLFFKEVASVSEVRTSRVESSHSGKNRGNVAVFNAQ